MMGQISPVSFQVTNAYDKVWYLADKESSIDSTNSLRVSFNSETSNHSHTSKYSYSDSALTNIPTEVLSYVQGWKSAKIENFIPGETVWGMKMTGSNKNPSEATGEVTDSFYI